jgi:hypothetical protein
MGRLAPCMAPSGRATGYPRNGRVALAAPRDVEGGVVLDVGEP